MNPIIRNILAVLAGLVLGGLVNMGIIQLGPILLEYPSGYDPNDMESIVAAIPDFHLIHFMHAFLAHALGTLVAAFVATKIAGNHQLKLSLGIGLFFLIGGVTAVQMMPSTPIWFIAMDLLLAYLPMGWLGWKLGFRG